MADNKESSLASLSHGFNLVHQNSGSWHPSMEKLSPFLTATAESKCANSGLADWVLVDYGFMYSDVDWSAQNGYVSSQGRSGVRLHKEDECDSLSNTSLPLATTIQNMRPRAVSKQVHRHHENICISYYALSNCSPPCKWSIVKYTCYVDL